MPNDLQTKSEIENLINSNEVSKSQEQLISNKLASLSDNDKAFSNKIIAGLTQKDYAKPISFLLDQQLISSNEVVKIDSKDTMLLGFAFINHKFKVADTVVKHGAELNIVVNNDNGSPLPIMHYALQTQQLPPVQMLLEAGWGWNNNELLHLATQYGNEPALNYLITERKVDINYKSAICHREGSTHQGGLNTPLAEAALVRNNKFAEILLQHGANPDISVKVPSTHSKPILKFAIKELNFGLLELLLEHGASVNVISHKKTTLLGKTIHQYTKPNEPANNYQEQSFLKKLADMLINYGANILSHDSKNALVKGDPTKSQEIVNSWRQINLSKLDENNSIENAPPAQIIDDLSQGFSTLWNHHSHGIHAERFFKSYGFMNNSCPFELPGYDHNLEEMGKIDSWSSFEEFWHKGY